MIGDTTNKEDVLTFLKDYIYPKIVDINNTMICFDNHASHYANIVKNWIEKTGLKILRLPTYSSELNPCEWIWKLFKERWYKELYRLYLDPSM